MKLADEFDVLYSRIEAASNGEMSDYVISTGIPGLDDGLNGGYARGQLIIIAARPGTGKSVLCLQNAMAAAKAGRKVKFFTLEMSTSEHVMRLASCYCNLSPSQLLRSANGLISQKNYATALRAVTAAKEKVQSCDVEFIDQSGLTIEQIRELCKKDKPGLVVIDYLQLVRTRANRTNREQEVAEVSRQLKELAKDLNIPVVAAAQVNRGGDSEKAGKQPKLHHLRESGQIEQDADVVLFLHKPPNKLETKIYCEKQRAGSIFHVWAKMSESSLEFVSVARVVDDEGIDD